VEASALPIGPRPWHRERAEHLAHALDALVGRLIEQLFDDALRRFGAALKARDAKEPSAVLGQPS